MTDGAPTPYAVELREVHMIFPVRWRAPVHALRGLSLAVPRGSIFGLLGPNGCGKTTAISCVLGLLLPQSGTVFVEGRDVRAVRADPRGRPYGVLLEDTRLPPFLRVSEALADIARLRGFESRAVHAERDRVVALCGIEELLARRVGVLSKGQARRVGLAAALVGDPRLLLLDEPSSGLDVSARVEFESLLRSLNDGTRTILVASHFLGDVQNTCTHVAVMADGAVLATGRTHDLLGPEQEALGSEVHVAVDAAAHLAAIGLEAAPSRYRGLLEVRTDLDDESLLRLLLEAGITPRRLEPRVSLLSVYLKLTHEDRQP